MPLAEWIGIVCVAVAIVLIVRYELRSFFCWLRKRPAAQTRMSVFIHGVFLVSAGLLIYAFFIEPYWLQVTRIDIATEKLERTDFTLVQIADLHCDVRQRNEKKIVDLVNKIDPDIIVFTGDSVNTPEALPNFKAVLRGMNARLGKVAVKGNWDVWYWGGIDIFGETGFEELDGKVRTFFKQGEAVSVAGFDPDQRINIVQGLLGSVPQGAYSVLLSHYPGINEEIGNDFFDLILSGHTHGGQVALPFYGAVITLSRYGKKYESGAYRLAGDRMMYVSRGIGMEGGFVPRVRFLSRPEITVFHIRPRSPKGDR